LQEGEQQQQQQLVERQVVVYLWRSSLLRLVQHNCTLGLKGRALAGSLLQFQLQLQEGWGGAAAATTLSVERRVVLY
jgi:hypothetical protein